MLPSIAQKRLDALIEAGGYGGGMRIAMRDLELRGAGDILGTEQSGNVSSVGFHLYCKLLKRTIEGLQGKGPAIFVDTKVEMPFDARIPEGYIADTKLRMEIYQRLGEMSSMESAESLLHELRDRFGSPPAPVLWLYHITRIRIFASSHYLSQVQLKKHVLYVQQKKGKEVVTHQIILGKVLTPQELEQKVILLLQREFLLKVEGKK